MGEGAFTIMANVSMADLFPLRERSLYIAMYAGASCFGAALAPLIGGSLTQFAGWQYIFWINLPIAAVTLALTLVFLPFPLLAFSRWTELKKIDLLGIVLVTSGTTAMLLGLQFGGVFSPWHSPKVIGLLTVGAVILILFIAQQQWLQFAQPLVHLGIFRNRTGGACMAVVFFHGFAHIAVLFYLPVYFELVLDVSTFEAGLWLLLAAVPTTIVTIAAALIIQRTGKFAKVVQAAAAFLALGLGLAITFPSHKSLARIVLYQLILAVGIGPLFQAPLIGLQASVKKEEVSSSYATAIFLCTMGSAVGLVVGQVVLSNEVRGQSDELLFAGVLERLVNAMQRDITVVSRFARSQRQQDAVVKAIAFSLSRVWIACTVVAVAGFLVSCLILDIPMASETASTDQNDR